MQRKNLERDVNHMIKRIISLILLITVAMCSCITAFASDVNLSDIDSSHWAYAAISELVGKKTVNGYPDGTFKPNGIVTYAEFEKMITGEWKANPAPINREAALDMLWSYSGKPENYSAPGIITSQMANTKAAAWGYDTGLMQGNDGLNLRPADTLTRAEAATLIVRSTKPVEGDHSFVVSISENILKLVWDTYGIFSSDYIPEEKITAEELWTAAKKFGALKSNESLVQGTTVEDAATLLIYSSVVRSKMSITVKTTTDGVTDKYGPIAKIYAAYAYENGLVLPSDASAQATKKDIALLLIQLDDLIGKDGLKINKNMAEYPANFADYAFLTEGVPVYAYTVPFGISAKPVDTYKFANNFSFIFENFLTEMENKYDKDKVDFTFYPNMACQNDTDMILRVKCTVKGATGYEIFGSGFENAGSEFYMDIHTGEPISNLFLSTSTAKIGKFICNQ